MFRLRPVRRTEFFQPMSCGWWIASSLFAASILLVYGINQAGVARINVCPTKVLFKIPCPLCRGTTSTVQLLRGEFVKAFALNPLAVILVTGSVFWCVLWLVFGKRLTTTLSASVIAALLMAALMVNWAYILATQP